MKIKVSLNCDLDFVNKAAGCTSGTEVKANLETWMRNEHSPLRMIRFFIEIEDLMSFVSVHLVRHGKFAEHFVKSNREDRGGDSTANRFTPINHCIETNAQEIIAISRKRLCYKASKETREFAKELKIAMNDCLPELTKYMVPECVYRNGICPEAKRCCKIGPKKMNKVYDYYPDLFK